MMKKIMTLWLPVIALAMLAACSKKEVKQARMVVPKPQDELPVGIQHLEEQVLSQAVDWQGKSYVVNFSRQIDRDKPLIDDGEGVKYYDNSITVRVDRQDGSTFFTHTYTKNDFARFADADAMKRRTLYNISVFGVKPEALSLLACVSAPDESSDDFQLLEVRISPDGSTSVREATVLEREVVEE